MPNRVIREGMLTSDPVNALTWAGECFFYRLMLKADDFGRFDARESILRASLYPLKISDVREADITRWMAECQKAGLIVLYEVVGKRYIQIPKFDQRKRALHSKWPTSDGHMTDICQHSAPEGERRETEKPRSEKDAGKARCSQPEAEEFCESIGLPKSDGRAMFLHWEEKGWGKIKDWRLTIRKWKEFGYLPSQKSRNGHKPGPTVPTKVNKPQPERWEAWRLEHYPESRESNFWRAPGDVQAEFRKAVNQ